MDTTDLLIVALGVFLYGLFSRWGERGSLTGPMVFCAFGLVCGPAFLDLVDVAVDGGVMHTLAELTLVLVLFTDAARIDVSRLGTEHNVPLRLLGVGLPVTMILGTAAALLLFPAMELWEAAVLGVILSPTDAALGQAVVTNPAVPVRVRQALNVESGLNDGLAFPVLLIVLSLAVEEEAARGLGAWALFVAGQLALGPLAGLAVGVVGSSCVEWAARRGDMNRAFVQISVLSLALLAFGTAEVIGGNGFIAAFVAGVVVGTRSRTLLDAVEDFGETEGQLLNLVVFLLFGAVLVPTLIDTLTAAHVLYAVLSLTLVRMGPVALCLIGTRLTAVTVAFIGWFGPRGLASILYVLIITEGAGEGLAGLSEIVSVAYLTVVLSIVAHGVSASPFAAWYARHIRGREDADAEHNAVLAFPTRSKPRHGAAGAADSSP
ncbi:sodium:proton antiporter [Acuticoccus sp. I52.16.1]|uniref:cation:proton antiporter n=1 Tax=Acuticoccus sp. I52.16.1 TaxID=2928472 RepID=UPI001FD181FA|nr:cation:proton antiporter [Acuticoccus sp. I52.16.1]UOM34382.1 cation:proton antiporter [Acuticoccus sp. I52.16.1]